MRHVFCAGFTRPQCFGKGATFTSAAVVAAAMSAKRTQDAEAIKKPGAHRVRSQQGALCACDVGHGCLARQCFPATQGQGSIFPAGIRVSHCAAHVHRDSGLHVIHALAMRYAETGERCISGLLRLRLQSRVPVFTK